MATIKSYTDLEQSKKLVGILPLESADMMYQEYETVIGDDYTYYYEIQTFFSFDIDGIPCWSLAALLGVIKEQGLVDLRFLQSTYDNRGNRLTNVWCCTFENLGTVSLDLYADNPIDACVAMIEKLHELKML